MGNIVWLASYPKSGNTWIRAFLANLIANRSAPVALDELPRYGQLEADPDRFGRLAGRPSTQLDLGQISELRPRVQAEIAAQAPNSVFVKTHSMAGINDGYPLHNPDVSAGAIYVLRNPLDVVISMSHHFGISLDEAIMYLGNEAAATENSELFVTEVLGSWSRHVKSWSEFDNDRILVLRYEDLLDKPAKGFGKIARLIGLAADRQRIERAIQFASFGNLAELERRNGFAEVPIKGKRFFRAGRANQWRQVLSRDQVMRVITDHREQMARWRYLPAGY